MSGRAVKVPRSAGPFASFYKALFAMGATTFCPKCYCYVVPRPYPDYHRCPDWAALGLATFQAPPAVVTLEGQLDPDDLEGAPDLMDRGGRVRRSVKPAGWTRIIKCQTANMGGPKT